VLMCVARICVYVCKDLFLNISPIRTGLSDVDAAITGERRHRVIVTSTGR